MTNKKTFGITGASGALGRALIKVLKSNGHNIIGLTHNKNPQQFGNDIPNKWVYWECGSEFLLKESLNEIDILILNHGIYDSSFQPNLENSIEINALSKLKIFNLFKNISISNNNLISPKEIWINTSEAELLPALNPCYEISKNLIGQSITFEKNFLTQNESKKLIIKKLILGPFKSELNPIGIMSPNLVANLIYLISKYSNFLILVSPNPITYIIFPIKEFYFFIYYYFLKFLKKNF